MMKKTLPGCGELNLGLLVESDFSCDLTILNIKY